ncbi:MAG: hypothetical protein ACYDAQ_06050 [Mycobacteriales bacterium]
MHSRPGAPGRAGSRRWRKSAARARAAEVANRRRIRAANARAARLAADFAVSARAARVVIGDPRGVGRAPAGPVHRRRLARWARSGARDALGYRLAEAGIAVSRVDERGTNSRCPSCAAPASSRLSPNRVTAPTTMP